MVEIFTDKKFLKECAIILLVGFIVNGFCFLLPFVVHAESVQYFPFNSGDNPNGVNVNQSFVQDRFDDGALFIYVYSDPSSSYPNRTRYEVLENIEVSDPSILPRLYGEIINASNFQLSWNVSPFHYEINHYLDWVMVVTFTLLIILLKILYVLIIIFLLV